MSRRLGPEDIDPAIVGGMLLSAGGNGRNRIAANRLFCERALARGPVELMGIAELDAQAEIMIVTAVGAPGGGKHLANPDHSIRAARQLLAASRTAVRAVIPGHVPGTYSWLIAAELGIPLLDAACNGRGHPTVKMGSLGLSSQPGVRLFQCGVGDNLTITVHGNIELTSSLMRAAAIQNGGLIMACRGPVEAALVASAGALDAITYQLELGRAMLAAGPSGDEKLAAVLDFAQGRLLAVGTVLDNDVAYQQGFDVGTVTIRDGTTKSPLTLGVCNEFMTAEWSGERIATFPDLIAAIDVRNGDVLAVTELTPGAHVAIVAVSKRELPLGAGIYDPHIYPDVERSMNTELARYALDRNA
ncbi:MAG: hypothetical protein JWR22_2193 [Herminiimonas sp.]|nr:hypothetical protein [Herminiimonas sp.]